MYKSKWAVQEETAQHGQTTSPAVKATPPPTETPASKTVDEPVKPEQTSDPAPSTQQPLEPEAAYSQPTPEPEVQQTAETSFVRWRRFRKNKKRQETYLSVANGSRI